jgi:thiosulfate/3-mercaptopyruvate sulfurtransferase
MGLAGLIVSALAAAPFVAVEQAEALVRDGAAVLDARGGAAFEVGHLPGAQPIDWRALSRPRSGRLSDDTAGQARDLAALGVDAAKPVLVYGAAAAGHGEEGLVAWTIAWLGHSRVRILDGGFAAWAAAGRPIATGRARPPVPGRFPAQPAAALRAVLADARAPPGTSRARGTSTGRRCSARAAGSAAPPRCAPSSPGPGSIRRGRSSPIV